MGIPTWRRMQIAKKEAALEDRAIARLGVLFDLNEETGAPNASTGGDVNEHGSEWVAGKIRGILAVADATKVPAYGPEGNEINRLRTIASSAGAMLDRVRQVEPARAAIGVERVWLEMFLEAVLLLSSEVKQPAGKYGAHLEINLRLVCDLCDLAVEHLRILAPDLNLERPDPFLVYRRPVEAVAPAPAATFSEDDF